MALTKTLLQLRTAVINEASIDGQTGTTGRHSPTNLNELINRYIQSLLSLVARSGGAAGQVLDAITAIPAATANEDFIEIDYPAAAEEIIGVDVQVSGTSQVKWHELDAADWSQRRLLNFESSTPEGGIGWWAVKSLPVARASATVTDGVIALFPASLSGSYRVTYLEHYTEMTDDTHKFVGHADWFTWVINSVAMQLTKRDNNKKANFQAAQLAKADAEARIIAASRRSKRGAAVPKRVGGELF